MSAWPAFLGTLLMRVIPPPVAYGVAWALAHVVYLAWAEKRRNAIANMRRVLGPDTPSSEVHRRVRAVFRNYARYCVDVLRLPTLDLREVERRLEVRGWEHIEQAVAAGKGTIFVGAHMGSIDLAGALMAARGVPLNVIAETLRPKQYNDLVQRTRARVGMKVITIEESARKVLGVLRRNEMLAILIDRPLQDEGIPVEFFAGRTRVPAGAATLALKTGASLVTGCVVRQGDRFVAHVGSVIRPEPTGDKQRDQQALTQRLMQSLEGLIRQYPDQWYMFRPMWPLDGAPS